MNPARLYFHFISAGSFAATVVMSLYAAELMNDETFEMLYSPAVWACLKLPFFVTAHEQWMERFGVVRDIWREWKQGR